MNKNPDQRVPFVSICIPAFNQERTIRETLESALSQTYSNLEVLVSDHGSTDKTREILSEYSGDSRLRVLDFLGAQEPHLNWNFVTSRAAGDYLCLLPGDDLIRHDSIEKRVNAFLTHSRVVMVASRRSVIDASGTVLITARGLRGMEGVYSGELAVRKCVASGSNIFGEPMCVMVDLAVLRRAGGWSTDLPFVIDQATYFRILEHGNLVAIPEVLASFRLSDRQMSYRLLSSQSREVRRLHWRIRSARRGSISRAIVLRGNMTSSLLAIARRFLYFLIRHRGNNRRFS